MTRRATAIVASLFLLWVAAAAGQPTADGLAELQQQFLTPPPETRIMMRWWWFGPAVTEHELERELRAMKDAGIGGVEIQPVYPLVLDSPASGLRNLPYLSDEFIRALRFAAGKARELGLRVDLTLGSGWPYGGPQVGVDDAAGKLRVERTKVTAESSSAPAPAVGVGEKFVAAFLDDQNLGALHDGAVALPDGHGSGEVLFFIASRTGMMVKRAAVGAEGFVLNHYDRGALDTYLKKVGDRLMEAFGANPPFAIFCDSLEVYDSDWTADFLDQFRTRRGYDLTPHLPRLVNGNDSDAMSIRRDWGQTLTDLLNERFVDPMKAWARRHDTRFRMQAYGIPPATLSTSALVDLPEGEGVQWKTLSPTRWASSASHIYGRPVTSSETWTWLHSPSFRATPLDVKAEADLHFLQGVNQLIGHGWPYTAEGIDYPGWRFYAAGVFNDSNPWWIVMPDVTRYLQRLSFLLRQGAPVNDVAIYLPTGDAWAHFTPGRVNGIEALRERMGSEVIAAVLDAGFNFDFVDDEALRQHAHAYRAIVVPGVERIPLETLRALAEFERNGGILLATVRLPDRAPGFASTDVEREQIRTLSNGLWGSAPTGRLLENSGAALRAELTRRLSPDVVVSPASPEFGFVHRHTDTAEIYFVANTGNRSLHGEASFRVRASSAEWWNPLDGRATPALLRSHDAMTAAVLDLLPYESRVLVFSTASAAAPARARRSNRTTESALDISADWTVTFGRDSPSIAMSRLQDWIADARTRHFSGVATYQKDVALPGTMMASRLTVRLDLGEGRPIASQPLTSGMRAWLDPPVREAAVAFVNGRRAGSIWMPPYSLDVTPFIHAGTNTIRIDVANTAINDMARRALPDYRLLNLRYGVRFEPQDMDKVHPEPSGLTGPVRLVVSGNQ